MYNALETRPGCEVLEHIWEMFNQNYSKYCDQPPLKGVKTD